jgi:hypothetical protein
MEMFQVVENNLAVIVTGITTIGYYRNRTEIMKAIINSHSEKLNLIERVEAMHRKYERVSYKMSLLERKLLEAVLSGDRDKINFYRDKLLDIMSFSFIPAFKYYAEAFFTIYSSSSADMDYFFKSRLMGFLKIIISEISIANDEQICPNRKSTTGISRLDVDELFRIANRYVAWWQVLKKWELHKLKKLFESLIKEYPAILPERMADPTQREALQAAMINKVNDMDKNSLQKTIDFTNSLAKK